MSLRFRIVSGYFETALARESSDQLRTGNTEKHIRGHFGISGKKEFAVLIHLRTQLVTNWL
jgi:hypothetical protein